MLAREYIKTLLLMLTIIFTSTFIYAYYYSKFYPIPISHRISLDAKLMFIRDFSNKDQIDTIIIGSSMGLNNLHGDTLLKSSKHIDNLLNISAFSLGVSQWEYLWKFIGLFPNLKRIIYSTQSLDFTNDRTFQEFSLDFAIDYTKLGKNGTNPRYIFYTFKNLISVLQRNWEWKEKFMSNNKYTYLGFDNTGGINLQIYGNDIDPKKWNDVYAVETTSESYQSLSRLIENSKTKHIEFYVIVQPYRKELIQNNTNLRRIVQDYQNRLKSAVKCSGGKYLNLDKKLKLSDEYFVDRIHLNDKGNVITAHEVANFIDQSE
ncbi:MAG TPA: SGNH/GDSL hydrolase family protein [Arcobacter sp.]|nr:SGNH/GDSL hydrolase family protein [Arcobacter sp.]